MGNSIYSETSDFSDVVTHTIDRKSQFFKQLTAKYQYSTSSLSAKDFGLHTEPENFKVGEIILDLQNVIDSGFTPQLHSPYTEVSEHLGTDSASAFKPIYPPSGKWEWMAGHDIIDDEETFLSDGAVCSAYIKKGTIFGRRITYVCKSWRTHRNWHNAFYSELALYKKQLRPLQGSVVPSVMTVFTGPCSINVAMEPPHHSFWIEASVDIPLALKDRCVEAYAKLHAQGVYHGDVELRHMLIGGDAKVTIIDFQESAALEPIEAVGLECATQADLRKEMRKVKVKLDYPGARELELKKRQRCLARLRENEEETRKAASQPGYTAKLQDALEEDVLDPPILSSQEWADWIATSPLPRRFVVPGQTRAKLHSEIQAFLALFDGNGQAGGHNYTARPHDDTLPLEPRSTRPRSEHVLSWQLPVLGQSSSSSSQKRRAVSDIDSLAMRDRFKRPRTILKLPDKSSCSRFQGTDPGLILERTDHGFGLTQDDTGDECAGTSTITDPPFSPVVSRYSTTVVPVLPNNVLESVLPFASSPTLDRIRMQNLGECASLELPHPTLLALFPQHPRWQDPELQVFSERRANRRQAVIELARRHPERSFKLPPDLRSLGSLKRCIEHIRRQLELSTCEGTPSMSKRRREENFESDVDTIPRNAKRARCVGNSSPAVGPGNNEPATNQVIPLEQGEMKGCGLDDRPMKYANRLPWLRSWMQKLLNSWKLLGS